jgi:16S rRNA G966 N2-methylase RsmD
VAEALDGLQALCIIGRKTTSNSREVHVRETFWKRQRRLYVKPWLNTFNTWKHVSYGGTKVYFKRHLDGGGSDFGQDFIPFLKLRNMPPQRRVFEWCAGPGFIGFSLLANGLAETLCLADVNPEAVEACRRTVRENGLSDRVAVYRSDNLAAIPASEKWDLVVANPPHLADDWIGDLRTYDDNWHIHRGFFAAVEPFLKPGGVVVLQENNRGSTAETFRSMIEASGLTTVFVAECRPQRTTYDRFYFIGLMRRGDPLPQWVRTPSA